MVFPTLQGRSVFLNVVYFGLGKFCAMSRWHLIKSDNTRHIEITLIKKLTWKIIISDMTERFEFIAWTTWVCLAFVFFFKK